MKALERQAKQRKGHDSEQADIEHAMGAALGQHRGRGFMKSAAATWCQGLEENVMRWSSLEPCEMGRAWKRVSQADGVLDGGRPVDPEKVWPHLKGNCRGDA